MFSGISLVTARWGNRMANMDTIRFDSLVLDSSHSCRRDESFGCWISHEVSIGSALSLSATVPVLCARSVV